MPPTNLENQQWLDRKLKAQDDEFVIGKQMISSQPESISTLRSTTGDSSSPQERKQRRRVMKTQSEGVAFMRSSLADDMHNLKRSTLSSVRGKEPESKLETLSELVQMSTKVCHIS